MDQPVCHILFLTDSRHLNLLADENNTMCGIVDGDRVYSCYTSPRTPDAHYRFAEKLAQEYGVRAINNNTYSLCLIPGDESAVVVLIYPLSPTVLVKCAVTLPSGSDMSALDDILPFLQKLRANDRIVAAPPYTLCALVPHFSLPEFAAATAE